MSNSAVLRSCMLDIVSSMALVRPADTAPIFEISARFLEAWAMCVDSFRRRQP